MYVSLKSLRNIKIPKKTNNPRMELRKKTKGKPSRKIVKNCQLWMVLMLQKLSPIQNNLKNFLQKQAKNQKEQNFFFF